MQLTILVIDHNHSNKIRLFPIGNNNKITTKNMSYIMRKPAFMQSKGADQLCDYRTANLRLAFNSFQVQSIYF